MNSTYHSQFEAKRIRGSELSHLLSCQRSSGAEYQASVQFLTQTIDELMLANMSLVKVFNIRFYEYAFDEAQLDLRLFREDRSILHFQACSSNAISEDAKGTFFPKSVTVTEMDPKDREIGQHDYDLTEGLYQRVDTFQEDEQQVSVLPTKAELRRLGDAMLRATPTGF